MWWHDGYIIAACKCCHQDYYITYIVRFQNIWLEIHRGGPTTWPLGSRKLYQGFCATSWGSAGWWIDISGSSPVETAGDFGSCSDHYHQITPSVVHSLWPLWCLGKSWGTYGISPMPMLSLLPHLLLLHIYAQHLYKYQAPTFRTADWGFFNSALAMLLQK